MGMVQTLFAPRTQAQSRVTSISQAEFWDIMGGGEKSKSGQTVNDSTALRIVTVFACIRVLAETIGSLPLDVIRRRKSGGKEKATEHQLYSLLHDRANTDQSSMAWRETLMGHLGLRGNGYCEKEYDNRGRVIGLWPIKPDCVTVERKNYKKTFLVDVDGTQTPFGADKILHVPGFGYDGLIGYSPIAIARDAIGLALAAQEHGSKTFENGTDLSGVLEHPGVLSKEAGDRVRQSFESKHKGTSNAGRVFIAEEAMKWTATGVSNKDSQFLETRKYQTEDIARLYRVPLHMIGNLDRATFSNIEQQDIDFVTHTIRPWLVRLEQIFNWELFSADQRGEFFCEFNVEGLLRGDSAARAAFYKELSYLGAMSPNEIREKENMNSIDGGDQYFVQGNMVLLTEAAKIVASSKIPKPADTTTDEPRAAVFLAPVVRDALERAMNREGTAAARAAKKGAVGLRDWLNEFENDHTEYTARVLTPAFDGVLGREATVSDLAVLRSMVAALVAEHASQYRAIDASVNQELAVDKAAERLKAQLSTEASSLAERLVTITTSLKMRSAA